MQRPPVRPSLRRLSVLAALAALGGLSGHAPTLAHAATLTVTVCDKSHLDAAIAIATAAPGDTITFACSGTITDNLTISQNLTLDATGQQVTLDGGGAGSVITVLAAHLTLTALTITHGSNGSGGGGIFNQGTATLTNSTVSGNTAAGGLGGGGIFNQGTATLTNSTVSGNTAAGGLGGGGIYNEGTVTLRNTILAGNSAPIGPDCSGTLTSGGYNLLGNNSACAGLTNGAKGDQVGTAAAPIDPLLGSLQDNGGPTFTQALQGGSPAIDVVPATNLGSLTTDQRGLRRPDNGETLSDIGAYEVQDPATICTGPSCQTNATPELGSGELLATGLLPLGAVLLYRRRRARRRGPM